MEGTDELSVAGSGDRVEPLVIYHLTFLICYLSSVAEPSDSLKSLLKRLATHLPVQMINEKCQMIYDQGSTLSPLPARFKLSLHHNKPLPKLNDKLMKNIGHAGHYSTQSAMKTLVSPWVFALRFEAKTSFLPLGENIGKPSNVSLKVIRSKPVPSTLIL
jgi:hypothetical protein